MWNFCPYRRLSVYIFDEVTLVSTAHEQTTLVTIVLYKHNVAAKHGSSKPLTTNEVWLLELWIKSTCILASIPDSLWDMCKLTTVSSVAAVSCYTWLWRCLGWIILWIHSLCHPVRVLWFSCHTNMNFK